MGLILDTNLFIAAEKSKDKGRLGELLNQIPEGFSEEEALISVITASELLVGVHRATDEAIRNRRRAFVDGILDQFNAIAIDLRVAREHSRLAATLLSKGDAIGAHDSWIAATALAYGHGIVTANGREFGRVEGLKTIEVTL